MRSVRNFFAFCVATTLAAACAVGPDYVRPGAPEPAAYKEIDGWKRAQPQDELPRGEWWRVFGDPVLDELESQVVVDNQTIKAAEARVREARALTQQAQAALFPVLSGSAAASRAGAGSRSGSVSGSRYSVVLDANWEIDIWGRVRRQVEAAGASAQASAADLEAAKLSAQALLAQNYWLLRVQDAEVRLLNETIAAYEKSLQLTRNQYAVGVAARADVVQAEAQLRSTQAQAVDAGVARAQLEHAIATLIGKPPSTITIEPRDVVFAFPDVPVAVPSALLERRPDIAAAERRTAAANAQIGVAEAAFFPALTLSAAGGFQSSILSQLISLPNRFWSIGPAIAQTIFDAGLRRAQTEQAIAAYDETVATYRQTVLSGFQEVEDQLAALRILEQEAAVQAEAVRAAREAVTIVNNQYRAGIANYLAVVVLQAALLQNERTALSIQARRMTATVQLVKALGGGFEASTLARSER
jgi:NodT family efflux transporter outer membrane factor (OMF) lipoprotein